MRTLHGEFVGRGDERQAGELGDLGRRWHERRDPIFE
jgi:hypothetical protein